MPKRKTKAVEELQKDAPIATKKFKIELTKPDTSKLESKPKINAASTGRGRGRPKKVVPTNDVKASSVEKTASDPEKKSKAKSRPERKTETKELSVEIPKKPIAKKGRGRPSKVKAVAKKSPTKPKIEKQSSAAEDNSVVAVKNEAETEKVKPAARKRGRPSTTNKTSTLSSGKKPGRPKKLTSSTTGKLDVKTTNSSGRKKGKTSTNKKKNSKMSSEEPKANSSTSGEGDSWKNASSVYDFTANDIQGNPVSLEKYKGYVLLIVNVASKCGLTSKNYVQLVELDKKYRDRGLRILAFPCNQFSGQEPGSAEQICAYAKKKDVEFDMFEKIDVNKDSAHPLWKYLKMKQSGTFGDNIKWNFTKFLVNRKGQPVDRFAPTTEPLSITKQIEALL